MWGEARREHSRFLFRFHPKLHYRLATFRFDLRHIHFGWQFPGIDSPMSKQEEKEEELESYMEHPNTRYQRVAR